MSLLTTIIVDDEPLARERVRSLLLEEPDVAIAAECPDGVEAIAAIQAHQPDLAFLDIQMPEVNGFEVLRSLPRETWPVVIFVTAYDRHAVEAFEVHAVDYLLKPFKPSRFKEALARARAQSRTRGDGAIQQQLRSLLESQKTESRQSRIAVKENGRTHFIRTADIDWIEAAGNYLVLHVGKENHVIRDTLSGLESRLSPREFVRVSRSALANLGRVKELHPLSQGENVLVLRDGTRLQVTRPVRELEDILKFS